MQIQEHIPLRNMTTFKAGGEARYFLEAKTLEDIRQAISFSKEKGLPFFILGEGSNVLVSDEGFPGVVVKMSLRGVKWREEKDAVFVEAAAGERWDSLVEKAVLKGLYGIENLSGIPGTVGAAPIQNIGAYGAEVKDTIYSVSVFDSTEEKEKTLSNEECEFGYRESVFKKEKGSRFVVTSVTFKLLKSGSLRTDYKDVSRYFSERNVPLTLPAIRSAILYIRAGKFPDMSRIGTAGSFFKNLILTKDSATGILEKYPDIPHFPSSEGKIKVPLAWVLDNLLHLKGKRVGDVGFYEKQPLVVVNFGAATASEIKEVTEKVMEDIKKELGVTVEREIGLVGDFS